MSPAHLKAISLYTDLEALFERAKDVRNYTLNALPEEEVANLLVEELADVLVRTENLIERLCAPRSPEWIVLFDGVSAKREAA